MHDDNDLMRSFSFEDNLFVSQAHFPLADNKRSYFIIQYISKNLPI